eukprot:Amastigsp_a8265_13.p5 type:complete len:101 gc:universal Amastigsp_a8265_13:357-659(+)
MRLSDSFCFSFCKWSASSLASRTRVLTRRICVSVNVCTFSSSSSSTIVFKMRFECGRRLMSMFSKNPAVSDDMTSSKRCTRSISRWIVERSPLSRVLMRR